jgi:hypothetical protein
MGTSETTRERLNESDFAVLESMTRTLEEMIVTKFAPIPTDIHTWPKRYLKTLNEVDLEFIFSKMGSFTVRLAKSDRYKNNPPPIFYISVGKYPKQYLWEDQNECPVAVEEVISKIEASIQFYKNSIPQIQDFI